MNLKVMYRKGKTVRVGRGGSWYNDASYLRAASRGSNSPSTQYDYVGARLYRSLGGKNEHEGDV
jgi:formylglycine-generating enzyme required for sulfatase activity